jgi:hypothetical protein
MGYASCLGAGTHKAPCGVMALMGMRWSIVPISAAYVAGDGHSLLVHVGLYPGSNTHGTCGFEDDCGPVSVGILLASVPYGWAR